MRRWAFILIVSLLATTLSVALAVPWLAYWIGLSKIDGFPAHATHTATAEEVSNLYERLRISQPVQIDSISPYTYLLQVPWEV